MASNSANGKLSKLIDGISNKIKFAHASGYVRDVTREFNATINAQRRSPRAKRVDVGLAPLPVNTQFHVGRQAGHGLNEEIQPFVRDYSTGKAN